MKINDRGLKKPKVLLYSTLVGLTLVIFWAIAPALATTGHAGWLLLMTSIYTLVLMFTVARAQAESDKMAAIRRILQIVRHKK